MGDWREQLAGLGAGLKEQERRQLEKEAADLQAWRRQLQELDPLGQEVAQLGDAYGVSCRWEVSRFATYPGFSFRLAAGGELSAEWRGNQLYVRSDGREAPGRAADLTPDAVKDRLMEMVLSAAHQQRKVPGKRK